MKLVLPLMFVATFGICAAAPCLSAQTQCEVRSGSTRVALVELYTSEGCSSCPPADRWLSELPASGLGFDKIVPLALHVDYWNHLGWPDRFAHAQFTERQRAVSARDRRGFVYTPQRVINGRDYRPSLLGNDFLRRIQEINRRAPGASLALVMTQAVSRVDAQLSVEPQQVRPHLQADAFLALIESGLETKVRAGENQGRLLHHDFVVRNLLGPFTMLGDRSQRIDQSFDLSAVEHLDKTALAAFVQDRLTGDVLQAIARPLCAQ